MNPRRYLRLLAAGLLSALMLLASEQSGIVTLGGLPVPGATVTATQGDKKVTTVTDGMGTYMFPDLADGTWSIQVEMSGFSPLKQDVTVAPGAMPTKWELKIKPLSEIQAEIQTPALEQRPAAPANTATVQPRSNAPAAAKSKGQAQAAAQPGGAPGAQAQAAPPEQTPEEAQSQRAADGFLVNGSQLNGASSPFALNPAFGNNRRGLRSLYNFNLGAVINNSVLDANNFSQSGANTPKPYTNNMQFMGSVGGPVRIPHVTKNLGNFIVNYQFQLNRTSSTSSPLVPTQDERDGDLSSFPGQIINPATLLPFPNNQIPANLISPQAQKLLSYYPLPNTTNSQFNYQVALVTPSHVNQMQVRWNRQFGRKNFFQGVFAFSDTHREAPSIFQFQGAPFEDTTNIFGINVDPIWRHQFTPRLSSTVEFQFTRQSTQTLSFFENKTNVAGNAGIAGNNQSPLYWGPPQLSFGASQFTSLSDGIPSSIKPQTGILKSDSTWNHGRHNVTFGGDLRKQQFNYLNETNPRGSLTFNGDATGVSSSVPGSDFADFLLGIPDSSTLAFGNADKYLRATGYDAYVNDDWRVNSILTVNAGLRYEYNGPVTEEYGRLVNLDIGPGFANVEPVTGLNPVGSLTRQNYPASLVRADAHGFEPGIGLAWRPISGSSLVVRANYGLRFSPSVYAPLAVNMYQQAPLSTSVNLVNSPASPLSLTNPFVGTPLPGSPTPYTFGVAPNFLESYAQNWQLQIQRDLPWSLQMQITYNGIKGTRLPQLFYPNSYAGAVNPCPSCPVGYEYEESNGNSTREAGQIQLRRRLHNGLTANFLYTYAKAIDDIGGAAQDWLNLAGERGLSSTDQRQLLSFTPQYTTGMGIGGGTFLTGWRAAILKEWTFVTPVTWGTGMPLTPTYAGLLGGTTVQNVLRPNFTGAPLYAAPSGLALNPAAFAVPPAGEFGDAAVGSITGPDQFSFGASMQRTFRVSDRVSMDLRVDGTNVLNHVVFSRYDVMFNPNVPAAANQFGLPQGANQMRNLLTTFRFRF